MKKTINETLQRLNRDKLLLEALGEVFTKRVKQEEPNIVENTTNVELGEKYRAYVEAKRIIKLAFDDLSLYTSEKINKPKFNKGR